MDLEDVEEALCYVEAVAAEAEEDGEEAVAYANHCRVVVDEVDAEEVEEQAY